MHKSPCNQKPNIGLSIIFPSWNRRQDTLDYLGSIKQSPFPQGQIEIIMIDNHSQDGTVKLVQQHYPKVKIIGLDKNYGPAYARNRGIEKAQGELIFCSDNDQTLTTNTLPILANHLQTNPEVGVVGAKVVSKTKPHQIISCGYTWNRWLGTECGLKNCGRVKECDWIAGCSMMFKKSLVDKIGLFDEKFFFFGEDADFCLRAKKAGYKVVSLPNAIVYHGKSKSPRAKRVGPKNSQSQIPENSDFSKDYYDYYKAKFRLILKHSNLPQKIISISLHLTFFSLLRYLAKKKENIVLKVKAFSEALRNIEQ